MNDQELNDYRDILSKAYDGETHIEIENCDKYHDATVNMCMLDKSSEILKFCRKMSVFSNFFYNDKKFDNLLTRREMVKESLEKFFEKEGSRMFVIVTEEPESKDFLLGEEKLRDLVDSCKLLIYKVPKDLAYEMPHFTIADDVEVRVEHNIDEKMTATNVFHDGKMIACLKDIYETLKSCSTFVSYK